ncbi:hypothetical protein MP228_006863 [Amoeboaphelidium protococcarum]|nr:hypothetical protein MP228_006863 [Amoeboaphelidium protococcarum]
MLPNVSWRESKLYYASNYFSMNDLPYNSRFEGEFRGGSAIASHTARLGEGLARDAAAQAQIDAYGGVWLGGLLMEKTLLYQDATQQSTEIQMQVVFQGVVSR